MIRQTSMKGESYCKAMSPSMTRSRPLLGRPLICCHTLAQSLTKNSRELLGPNFCRSYNESGKRRPSARVATGRLCLVPSRRGMHKNPIHRHRTRPTNPIAFYACQIALAKPCVGCIRQTRARAVVPAVSSACATGQQTPRALGLAVL